MAGIGTAISAGTSLLGSVVGGKGAAKAAKAQAQAQQQQLALEQNEFNTVSGDANPNINAGNSAVQQMLRLLGLGDMNTGTASNPYTAAQQQQGAIGAIQQGPQYQSEFNSGLDAINQSAAATGGLRGGNNALSESSYGSTLLNSLIQQSLGNLGTVAGYGSSALGTLSGAGNTFVNASGATNTALGNANATQAAAPYAALSQALGQVGGLFNNSGNQGYSGYGWGGWTGNGGKPF